MFFVPWTVPGFDYLILVEWFPLTANNKSLAPTPFVKTIYTEISALPLSGGWRSLSALRKTEVDIRVRYRLLSVSH